MHPATSNWAVRITRCSPRGSKLRPVRRLDRGGLSMSRRGLFGLFDQPSVPGNRLASDASQPGTSLTAAALALAAIALPAAAVNAQEVDRVAGGTPAAEGAWPFQVALLDTAILKRSDQMQAQFCGGTLIAPQWV